jgi:hypothetical protein
MVVFLTLDWLLPRVARVVARLGRRHDKIAQRYLFGVSARGIERLGNRDAVAVRVRHHQRLDALAAGPCAGRHAHRGQLACNGLEVADRQGKRAMSGALEALIDLQPAAARKHPLLDFGHGPVALGSQEFGVPGGGLVDVLDGHACQCVVDGHVRLLSVRWSMMGAARRTRHDAKPVRLHWFTIG